METRETLREYLARMDHEGWRASMSYLFLYAQNNPDGTITLPADPAACLKRRITTRYADLPQQEKEGHRARVDKVLAAIASFDGRGRGA